MTDQFSLFDDLPKTVGRTLVFKPVATPLWTKNKAHLIARYLQYFVFVTRHGTYIDGFAAPQAEQEDGGVENWSAKLVLQSEPKLLRDFWLCDIDKKGVDAIRAMVAAEPKVKGRKIEILHGDFNEKVDIVLQSGRIKPTTATFCLLDQRTFECKWRTVQRLAEYKSKNKIELFYFLGSGWLGRALAAVTRGHDDVAAWWGRDDWQQLRDMSSNKRANVFCQRFRKELDYEYTFAWPIYSRPGPSGQIMYHMIHCTDHPEAPKLMARAYRYATTPLESAEQLQLNLSRFSDRL